MSTTLCIAVMCATGLGPVAEISPAFTDSEKLQIQTYWSKPGRYIVETAGESAVRQTPEGSEWLSQFRKELGYQKGQPPPKLSKKQSDWKKWVDAELVRDRKSAEKSVTSPSESNGGLEERRDDSSPKPPDDLVAAIGMPPDFYLVANPSRYTVTFDSDQTFTYTDHVKMSADSPYYRFSQGVMSGGTPMRALDSDILDSLLTKAGISESEARIFRAVSLLEGGFDSVNTYDTGYVSVGFIQFACLRGGAGSLGGVLQRLKQEDSSEFDTEFRRFGLDVHEDGRLIALDIMTGEEKVGTDAALQIIEDKRLTAVFQRAGQISEPFKLAQLRVAKDRYYPANDPIAVRLGPLDLKVKVCDIIKSEAGIATLMDRKVNTGNIDLLPSVLRRFVESEGLTQLQNCLDFEKEIIRAVRWRKDYLGIAELSQPREVTKLASRSGSPKRTNELPDFRGWW